MKNLDIKKLLICLVIAMPAVGQVSPALQTRLDQQAKELEPKVIEWRRHFHQYPELSNRETKTGARIAEQLKAMGLEVQYPVAHTGVIAILKGGKPGPVIALRADIDALPVTERNSLPFASKERTVFNGMETGVMHACGHDGHTAILLGVADILSRNRSDLKGTVKFLFQPAEEGMPEGEDGGAGLMIKEGALENPKVDVIFGLHLQSLIPLGTIAYRPQGLMAAEDALNIKVKGKGAHGATPWDSVDPIVVSSEIMLGLQTIISRQSELTTAGAVITIGSMHAGIRRNIIPEEATMEGTIRTFDPDMQKKIHERIRQTATKIAESAGATAEVDISIDYPATYNDVRLTNMMAPSLQRVVGLSQAKVVQATTMAEDFSFFQQKVPGLFFFVGAYPADMKLTKQPTHHTADFMIDERCLVIGMRSLLALTTDYMYMKNATK